MVDIFHASKNKFEAALLTHRNPVISHIAQNVKIEREREREQE